MSKQSITLKNAVESAFFRMRLCHNQMSRGELLRLKTGKSLLDPENHCLTREKPGCQRKAPVTRGETQHDKQREQNGQDP